MKKIVSIDLEIYKAQVVVQIGTNVNKLNKYISRKWRGVEDVPELGDKRAGDSYQPGDGIFTIRIRKKPKSLKYKGALVHEIGHTVIRILRRAGMVLSGKSEEAYTYLMEYLYKRIYEELK